jgi:hypothetical protein
MNTQDRIELFRRWSRLLDAAFRVPGTRFRFGLDPLLGLIPGLGDIVTPLFAGAVLLEARRRRVPGIVQLRMLLNVALDAAVGAVPIAGDLWDAIWKANTRNLALLERHAKPGTPPRRGDWIVVLLVVALVGVIALIPLIIVVWLLLRFGLF